MALGFIVPAGLDVARGFCSVVRVLSRQKQVPHLRWSQAPPLPWRRQGSADYPVIAISMDRCGSTPIRFCGVNIQICDLITCDGGRIFFDLRTPEVTLKKLRVLPGVRGDTTCSCKQCQAKRRSSQCLRCVHRKPNLGQSYMDDAAKSS